MTRSQIAAAAAGGAIAFTSLGFVIGHVTSPSSPTDASTPTAATPAAAAPVVDAAQVSASTTAEPSQSSLIAEGSLLTADIPSGGGFCILDFTLLSATGDDGTIAGAVELEPSLRPDRSSCTYEFSFPVKESSTYTFKPGQYTVTGGGQYLAEKIDGGLLLVVN
jgi:hypothetical protein